MNGTEIMAARRENEIQHHIATLRGVPAPRRRTRPHPRRAGTDARRRRTGLRVERCVSRLARNRPALGWHPPGVAPCGRRVPQRLAHGAVSPDAGGPRRRGRGAGRARGPPRPMGGGAPSDDRRHGGVTYHCTNPLGSNRVCGWTMMPVRLPTGRTALVCSRCKWREAGRCWECGQPRENRSAQAVYCADCAAARIRASTAAYRAKRKAS